jgi:hypothetical protein
MGSNNRDCLDCLRIAISYTKGKMWCKERQWLSEKGEEKFVTLTVQERKGAPLRFRRIFNQAQECKQMEK